MISPLAPKFYAKLAPIKGLHLATAEAGIKHAGRPDVLLVRSEKAAQVAGVFTRSKCASAPVEWCRLQLQRGFARALLVNSGNANAFTGQSGREAVLLSARMVADAINCKEEEVFLASTGVIGEPLQAQKYIQVMQNLVSYEGSNSNDWEKAARAIMTTDTYPKLATEAFRLNGQDYVLNGIAKGAGMIQPDMATMLAFLFTDAPLAAPVLQAALQQHIDNTFNAITVDSDTSTSDTVLLFSVCAEKELPVIADDLEGFHNALHKVMKDLAHQVVRDGEGARKFVEITVSGAQSDVSAKKIAFSIANSPLVKTAIAGEDANWGRIVMAVGKAGEPADRDRLSIFFGNVRVACAGQRDPDYSEEKVSTIMHQQEIPIQVELGLGKGQATVWTCDLTKEYVAINGDYRT